MAGTSPAMTSLGLVDFTFQRAELLRHVKEQS